MSFRRPTHDDEIFTDYGLTYFIGHGANENQSMSIPWHQVKSIKKFINRGGIWKNCPIYVDRWTFGMVLYDMKHDT
jgi:hypothetical protein